MEKIKKLSTIGTIICIISIIIYVALALYIHYSAVDDFMNFASSSMDKINDVDSNSPSAGYEVLAYLGGGALGFIGGIFAIFIEILLGFLAVYQIPSILSGLIANKTFKKNEEITKCLKSYKSDGYLKAIMNGLIAIFAIICILGDTSISNLSSSFTSLLLIWNFIAVFILGIYQIKYVKLEEKKLAPEPEVKE